MSLLLLWFLDAGNNGCAKSRRLARPFLVTFPDDRDLVGARSKMSVDAIHRHVGGTVFEPFDGDFAGIEACILHLRVRLDPVDSPSVMFPEFIWSRSRESIHFPVL